jgi:uncharacterized membrane protein YcaP (DUF421 family)
MWNLSVPWWELLIRGVAIYAVVLVLLRITGKRQMGQISAFDFVLLLLLANAVQNAMNAGDNSLLAGLILAVTLVALNVAVGWLVFKNKRAERFIEGRPEVLIHNGHLYREILDRERLTQQDIDAALRKAGCMSIQDVAFAVLESNGEITVHSRKN